jgi:hypothetical protein
MGIAIVFFVFRYLPRNMNSKHFGAFLTLTLALLSGCGPSGPERASVSGKVTLNGQAIEQGTISFLPAEGNTGPSAGGIIANGRYDIKKQDGPVLGKSRVELRSWKKTGRQIPNPMSAGAMMDEKVEAFPDRFSNESTLIKEVQSGHNIFDFELESSDASP